MSPGSVAGMLSIVEARVIGCLLEKERTVPDQYPLTLNALVTACNQATSREPVMHLQEHEVLTSLTDLKSAGLVRFVHPSHGRSVTRYRQVADEVWRAEPPAAAVLAVLLLRGPQTVSELRTRCERQHTFGSLAEVEDTLRELADAGHVQLLDRQSGQKEARWQQLLADEPEPSVRATSARTVVSVAPVSPDPELVARVTELEARVARLESALADLLS